MYRGPRAAHLLTHYRHCQEGTMKEEEGVKEREGVFIQGNGKEKKNFQHLEGKFSYITCQIENISCSCP